MTEATFHVIDGKLVTGHINRHGQLVDIRPVKVFIRKPGYTTLSLYNQQVSVELQTAVDVRCGRGYDGLFTTSGRSHRLLPTNLLPDTQEYIMLGHRFPVVPPVPIVTDEEYSQSNSAILMRAQQAASENIRRIDEAERMLFALAPALAELWLKTSPKEARRFSSGREISVPWHFVGAVEETRLIRHGVRRVNAVVKSHLNALLIARDKERKQQRATAADVVQLPEEE